MDNLQPITAGITGQQAAGIILDNDNALLNGQLFNPALKGSDYDGYVNAGASGAGQTVRVTPEGWAEIYTSAGNNPNGGFVGVTVYPLYAGKGYYIKAILKFAGWDGNPISQQGNYFIYYEGASRIISTPSKITDLGGGRYLYERTLLPLTADGYIDLFGVQTEYATPATTALDNSIVCEAASVAEQDGESGVTSELTKRILEYLGEQETVEPLQIESDRYFGVSYNQATISADKRQINSPAGVPFDSSYLEARFQVINEDQPTDITVYATVSEWVAGLLAFIIRYPVGGGVNVNYYSPIPVAGDLYKFEIKLLPDATMQSETMFAIQQTTPTAPVSPFMMRLEKFLFVQNYGYSENRPAFQETAVQRIVNKAVAGLQGGYVTIVVSADPADSSAAFTGANAIQDAIDSITDASAAKRYRVFAKDGIYKITNSSQFKGRPGYPAMVAMKDYVDLEGQSMENTILWAELPYNDGDIDTAIDRILHQTMWNYAKENTVTNLSMVAKNIRYTLHQDDAATALSTRRYRNVSMQFIGDKGNGNVYGLGTWNGEKNYVDGGRAVAANAFPFACHTNTNFTEPSLWDFKNFAFIRQNGAPYAITLQNAGSKVGDELRLEGCTFGGVADAIQSADIWLTNQGGNDYFNHADYRVHGFGNAPFLWETLLNGASLRVTTINKGATQSVRFVAASSAFSAIIPEARLKAADIYVPSMGIKDGYIYQDGSAGLSGVAWGAKDVSYAPALYDGGIAYQSLGRRLGDCSAFNKTLGIVINSTTYNVVFNKDYTALSLNTILAEINAVIGAVATADIDTLGNRYYPNMPDVVETMINDSTTAHIPKGTVVQRAGSGRVVPCTDPANYYGVALDDIPVYTNVQGIITGQGRVLKRGYIDTGAAAFFVRTTKQAVYGDRFTINNGVLNADANGLIRTVRNGVVAIKC